MWIKDNNERINLDFVQSYTKTGDSSITFYQLHGNTCTLFFDTEEERNNVMLKLDEYISFKCGLKNLMKDSE